MGLRGIAVGCSNESCKKVQVTAEVIAAKTGQIGFKSMTPKRPFRRKLFQTA